LGETTRNYLLGLQRLTGFSKTKIVELAVQLYYQREMKTNTAGYANTHKEGYINSQEKGL
jgi:hypothetical protein